MKEIERKFLVKQMPMEILKGLQSKHIEQYYINHEPEIRIRQIDDDFFITIKKGEGLIREEIEVKIGLVDFETIRKLGEFDYIYKERFYIPCGKYTIELDFYNDLGLIAAEVEFPNEKEANDFVPPKWFDKEVTGISEYSNKNLAKQSRTQ